ncbi:MAG: ribonuclease HII, partial [Bacilli bacterium]|nr:ribonuclease HII [Bacilli bacterium]
MEKDNLTCLINAIITKEEVPQDDKEYLYYLRYLEMSAYENDLINQHITLIAGLDEAGRGPLAGPVVAGCCILPHDFYLPGLNDSKKLTPKKREELYEIITKEALAYSVGIVDEKTIDNINIYQATKLAMAKAVLNLQVKPEHLLIDALYIDLDIPQ